MVVLHASADCSRIAHMPVEDVQTIGRRIAEARTRARLTQADLAGATGLERSALAKIETGARRVTALELSYIAEQTGEPFEWFVKDAPAAINSYRNGVGAPVSASIDRLLERVARDVELLQSLGQLDTQAQEPLALPTELTEAEAMAEGVRRRLNLGPTAPCGDLGALAAKLGLFAFSRDLGPDAPDAAATLLADGGVSVINSDRAVGRRRLALAHELGHYLVADGYTVDWRVGATTDADKTERLLDAFARALMVPRRGVCERWPELVEHGSVRDAAIVIVSEYRVDMSTLAARLAELDIAAPDELAVVRSTTTTGGDIIEHDLVVAHDLKETTLPRAYEKAVVSLYRAERISPSKAVDLLHGTVQEAELPPIPQASDHEIWKYTS